jgi:predicted nuclease of predicted toxin-antitoxin system
LPFTRRFVSRFGASAPRRVGRSRRSHDLEYAAAHGFILVSFDADFVEMATLHGSPPKLIWLRRGNQPTGAIEATLREHAGAITAFEQDDAVCLEIY